MRKGFQRLLTGKPETEEQLHLKVAKLFHVIFDDRVIWTTVENSNQQGGKAGRIKQAILKAKGVQAGWPDIQIFWWNGARRMMVIELKSKRGRLQDNQKELHRRLSDMTISVVVCRSIEEVMAALETHEVPHLKTEIM
jgi:hypothetical protein